MKAIKVLKWTGITLVTAAGLTFAFIYGRTYHIFNKKYDVPLAEITIPADSASIAEGMRQVKLLGCAGCHGENLMGKVMREDDEFGRLVSANVTETIQDYSDAELYRLIRHGIKNEGKIALVMPAMAYYHLKDQSVAEIIAYLRTLEMQENDPPLPPMKFTLNTKASFAFNERVPGQVKMDHQAPRVPADFENDPIAHGNYLAKTVCSHCHGDNLEGSVKLKAPGLNLIFMYSREQFRHLMRTGEGPTRKDLGLMSKVASNNLKYLTDEEIDAVYIFLKSRLEDEEAVASTKAD